MGEKAKRQPTEYIIGRAGGFHREVSVRSIFFYVFINDMKMQHDMAVKQGRKEKKEHKRKKKIEQSIREKFYFYEVTG